MQIADMSYSEKQQAIRDYYAFCAYGDSLIGESVKAFKNYCEANEQEYLIILACGDHSWHLGEQGIEAKFGPYDMSNHTATIVVSSDKSKFPARHVNEDFIEYVDFAPTILTAAGIDVGATEYEYLDGFDLAKVVHGTLPSREYVLGEMNHVIGPRAYIRTKDFAFSMRVREKNNKPSQSYLPNNNIQWALTTSRENVEMALYDLRLDPKERNNVAYSQEYRALSDWFRVKLGNIVLGDGRVEVIWSEENSYDISNFALGSDDKKIDIPKEIMPRIQDFSSISFRVLKKNDSIICAENAKIILDSLVFLTDSTGFAIVIIKHGTYSYHIEVEGCPPLTKIIEIGPESNSYIDTLLVSSYNVRVSVLDDATKLPVEGALIEFGKSNQHSDHTGNANFYDIQYGNVPLSLSAPHYYSYSTDAIYITTDSVIEIMLDPIYYQQVIRMLNQWDYTPVKILLDFIPLKVGTLELEKGYYNMTL